MVIFVNEIFTLKLLVSRYYNYMEVAMKGGFFAGIALGALMGAMILELNPQAKKIAQKGQDAISQQVQNLTK